jgi:hypothetical protein
MPEGLSPSEVGKEIAEHHAHHSGELHRGGAEEHGRSRWLTILEATLLAIVAVLAAYSGFASAKFGTDSSLRLAKASTVRSLASRAEIEGLETKNFDALTFNDWFTAYVAGNRTAAVVAEGRFRPQFAVAFRAWIADRPFTSSTAPPGPTYMPEYVQPGKALADSLDAKADALYGQGASDGATSDDYVRTTVFLATVLFLVGISGHFKVRKARIGLISVGVAILLTSIVFLLTTPKPNF